MGGMAVKPLHNIVKVYRAQNTIFIILRRLCFNTLSTLYPPGRVLILFLDC